MHANVLKKAHIRVHGEENPLDFGVNQFDVVCCVLSLLLLLFSTYALSFEQVYYDCIVSIWLWVYLLHFCPNKAKYHSMYKLMCFASTV